MYSVYTSSNGAPVPHPYAAQRAGVNGPLLLQDFHLIDLLSHFDRERWVRCDGCYTTPEAEF